MKKLKALFAMLILALALVFAFTSHRTLAGDIEFPGYTEIPGSAGEGYEWVQLSDGLWYRMKVS